VAEPSGVFDAGFLVALEISVKIHHIIYPTVPPQGIYFEALVDQSFRRIRKPFTVIERTERNAPRHDLLVESTRISLKTETGENTHPSRITITKLCTTEREPWDGPTLIGRALEHLNRYDIILMLRAVWELPLIHYQVLEIPVETLRLIETVNLQPARGRGRSLRATVTRENQPVFNVFFDATDRKCVIRNFQSANCAMLAAWDVQIAPAEAAAPIRT
jgi:hypothetical protein